jgi:hypothetical protein
MCACATSAKTPPDKATGAAPFGAAPQTAAETKLCIAVQHVFPIAQFQPMRLNFGTGQYDRQ